MRFLSITLSIFAILFLSACNQAAIPPESEVQQTPNTGTTQDLAKKESTSSNIPQDSPVESAVDKPLLAKGEVESIIWSQLQWQLPSGYSMEHLQRNQLKVVYVGSNVWNFAAFGAKDTRELLTPEIEEKSEIEWIKYYKERITSNILSIIGEFYEKTRILNVQNVNQIPDKTTTNILKKEQINAHLLLQEHPIRLEGGHYFYDCTIRNGSIIPLSHLEVEISFRNGHTQREVVYQEKFYDTPIPTVLYERETAKFLFRVSIDNINDDQIYDYDYRFITPSGSEIPWRIDLWKLLQ